jgi:protein arginine N-methyltransferase 1
MSRGEIIEHARYLKDRTKLDAYRAALDQLIDPGSVVLDLGAGTGILGLLALRAGAGKVYSLDAGSIIATTEAIAEANGVADKMVFVQRFSAGATLPEPIDVVVGDQIGGLVYDAGVLDYYADARRRFLAPGGRLIPGSFELLAAPASAPLWEDTVGVLTEPAADVDVSPLHELAVNTEFRTESSSEHLLGPAVEFARVAADHRDPIKGTAELTIARPGRLNGILGMFVAELAPGIRLTNQPGKPETFSRWQNLYPLRAPVDVVPGDTVTVTFDLRPTTYLASWSIEVEPADGRPVIRSRGSTVLGSFLTPTDVAISTGRAVPRPAPKLAADRDILDLVDGERTIEEIADAVWVRHRSSFRSRDHVEGRVNHLLWRYLRPELPWPGSPTD